MWQNQLLNLYSDLLSFVAQLTIIPVFGSAKVCGKIDNYTCIRICSARVGGKRPGPITERVSVLDESVVNNFIAVEDHHQLAAKIQAEDITGPGNVSEMQ